MSAAGVSGRVLTAAAMNVHNTDEHPDRVVPAALEGARLRGSTLAVDLAPRSVVAIEVR